ncbi:MAG: hypothetical protein IJ600_04710, partial [Lachnospiraceae bacterium]|nr:hypothetical protein [Lachnospiraceae bacterium]
NRLIKEYQGICDKLETILEENGESELYTDLVGLIIDISDYILRDQAKARKEMNKMGGQILELHSEKVKRIAKEEGQKELAEAIKDVRNGLKPADLKKKYSSETIKLAKTIA